MCRNCGLQQTLQLAHNCHKKLAEIDIRKHQTHTCNTYNASGKPGGLTLECFKTAKLLFALCTGLSPLVASAVDTYDASTSVLTIDSVAVGDTLYNNVRVTLASVVRVGAQSVASGYDTYNLSTNELSIPSVVVGATTYYNVVVTIGRVLSVGGSCNGLSACYSALVGSASSSTNATSYAPAKFSSIVDYAYSGGTLATASSLVSKKRYLIGDSATTPTFWTLGTKGTDSYTMVSATIAGSTTYKDYLKKIVQVVVDSSDSNCFRFDPHLQSNYSLDVDTSSSNQLVFRNNWGLTSSSGFGYVCFAYNSSTKYLTATKRYVYSSTAYTHAQDTGFALAGYYVKFSNGVAQLVSSSALATQITLYTSPIDFNMPFDFNPNASTGSANSPMPFSSSYQKVDSAYLSRIVSQATASVKRQISANLSTPTIGYNATTVAAQDAMLDTIASTAESNNFSLRYPTSTYKTFRDAALQYKIYGDSVVDGTVGEYTVPMIYFTNTKDSAGVYHPAMIIVAYSVPETPHYLADVIRPPGGGAASISVCNQGLGTSDTGYGNQCVTRGTARQNFIFRVPLKNYGLTASLCENSVVATLYSDFYGTAGTFCSTTATAKSTIENYASTSENGVLIDGTSIYPVLNNLLASSQEEPSLNMHGCHVGQGYGYHCHSDGFSVMNNGMSIYNEGDYTGKNHPPLIGFGFDGIALYGRYLSNHSSMVGFTNSTTSPLSNATITGNDLDAYGGHTHMLDGSSVYHQHSRPYTTLTTAAPGVTAGKSYLVHSLITGAWRGQTNSIPNFWDSNKVNTKGVYPLLSE